MTRWMPPSRIASTQCGRPSRTLLTRLTSRPLPVRNVVRARRWRRPRSRGRSGPCATATAPGLSLSLHREERACPPSAACVPAPIWLLPNAVAKSSAMPMTSPVERISGPEDGVDARELREREHRLLDRDVLAASTSLMPISSQRLAGHDARRDLGQRHAGRLRDERHRARRARVDLEDEDAAAVARHRELHVHQADARRARAPARAPAS